jgi:hypothetical protein
MVAWSISGARAGNGPERVGPTKGKSLADAAVPGEPCR